MSRLLGAGLCAGVLALSALTGCAQPQAQGTHVVASFYPLAYVTARIGGSHVDVTDLTRPGQEPHDLELTVQQTADVADASLVVYAKGFQAAVDDAVSSTSPAHVAEVSGAAGIRADDPHFWLDPQRLSRVAAQVEKGLAEADPAHRAAFEANLAGLQRDLAKVDQEYRRGLSTCATRTMVVSHDAFSYLGKYGLSFAAINGRSPDAEPSPARLAQLRQLIQEDHLSTVFVEPLASPASGQTLADSLGIRTAVLDPIEGLTTAEKGSDYLDLMRRNLDALRSAGRCS
ncbi:MAG: zinc transport system substrate-binding protein [Nocardioidaceae bacterium]|nr:zinc transport system substrate-binding protein [Nocardioidaceae bacterium]